MATEKLIILTLQCVVITLYYVYFNYKMCYLFVMFVSGKRNIPPEAKIGQMTFSADRYTLELQMMCQHESGSDLGKVLAISYATPKSPSNCLSNSHYHLFYYPLRLLQNNV